MLSLEGSLDLRKPQEGQNLLLFALRKFLKSPSCQGPFLLIFSLPFIPEHKRDLQVSSLSYDDLNGANFWLPGRECYVAFLTLGISDWVELTQPLLSLP